MNFERYRECQQSFKTMRFSLRTFRGYDQTLYTIEQVKRVLSNFDSKVFVHSCNIHTSFFGSNMINAKNSNCYICKGNFKYERIFYHTKTE